MTDKIKRVANINEGPPDGVTAEIQCVVTQFERTEEKGSAKKGVERVIKGQANMPCKVLTAFSEGTIGFSVRDIDLMITVRTDELYEILKAASEAWQDVRQTLTDAEIEEKWRELEDVLFDEADSPHGLILAEPWLHFPKGVDRGDIWQWFDEQHSKGVAYLMGQTEE